MKACPFCAEEIQDAAIVCKHCGRALTKSEALPAALAAQAPGAKNGRGIFILLGLVAVIGVIFSMMNSPVTSLLNDPGKQQQLEDYVAKMQALDLIAKVNTGMHSVQVNPLLWAMINADQKQALASNIAAYCAVKTQSTLMYADVIDAQSGRKLAEWGSAGFKVD